jgi:hypothetical protein
MPLFFDKKKSIQDVVQKVVLAMTETTGREPTPKQISYVTSRLLDSPEKTMLGTGEGTLTAHMLLNASQALLGKKQDSFIDDFALIKRVSEDSQKFFGRLGLKAELTQAPDGFFLAIVSVETTAENKVQQSGKLGGASSL